VEGGAAAIRVNLDRMSLASVRDPTVSIDVRTHGVEALVVEFTGVLGHRDPGPLLAPLFEVVHRTSLHEKRREVRVDLRGLRFMNSSSFKHFVAWIRSAGALPEGERYRIRFVVNPAHHWQRVSMHALSCFSVDEITVEGADQGAAR
jgi:hypothetical protein